MASGRAGTGGHVRASAISAQLLTLGGLGLSFLTCMLVKRAGPAPSRRCIGSDVRGTEVWDFAFVQSPQLFVTHIPVQKY